MSGNWERLRYSPAQVVEAVDRARGDGRYFLVSALTSLPVAQREDALSQVLDMELRPDERHTALAELARLRPSHYLPQLIETGLRSRSINVQQMTVVELPELVGDGPAPELVEQVERWLRRRLANPRRERTWATWEIPGVALALLPSYGTDRVAALLNDLEPRMQPDERAIWRSCTQAVGDAQSFQQRLTQWMRQGGPGFDPEVSDPTAEVNDPTADIAVDRVMKRLGYKPANPNSRVYHPPADFDVPMYVVDASDDEPFVEED